MSSEADLSVCCGPGRSGLGVSRRLLLVRSHGHTKEEGVAREVSQNRRGSWQEPAHTPSYRGLRPKQTSSFSIYVRVLCSLFCDFSQVFLSLVQGTNLIQRLINMAYTYDNLAHRVLKAQSDHRSRHEGKHIIGRICLRFFVEKTKLLDL